MQPEQRASNVDNTTRSIKNLPGVCSRTNTFPQEPNNLTPSTSVSTASNCLLYVKTRPGGIDKLPADFKPRFNFVLAESASGIRRAAEGKEAWLRPKPFETVNVLGTNRCCFRVNQAADRLGCSPF